jgi:hypothetical protein
LNGCPLCGVYAEAQSRVNDVFSRTSLLDLLQPRGGRMLYLSAPER